jgi:putative OPT family oligopeptide transporter
MNGSVKQYREITPLSVVVGITIGIILVAAITYSGLVIGFTIVGSTIAAIIGWGVLKGISKKGTIVENNITQTIASSLNVASAGVIFTIPVLFLRGVPFEPIPMVLACIAGSFLGFFFIIPLRKQMIDLERLRFPSGMAVATILRSPGASMEKLVLLGIGVFVSAAFTVGVNVWEIETVDLGRYLAAIPPVFTNVWALSLMCVGAGYLTGKAGFLVLIGGILSYWVVTPISVSAGWVGQPVGSDLTDLLEISYKTITRPMGIGMLVGGAIMGIIVSLPSIRAAFLSLMRTKLGDETEEMPVKLVGVGALLSFAVLTLVALLTSDISVVRALVIAAVGTLWLALAGVVIAQCAGMTDWSPISGISMMGVAIVLWLSGGNVVLAVTMGATICMALSQCSDIMQDLKTGFVVGAKPIRQQATQLAVTWIGPIVSILVVYLLAESHEFGSKQLPAPQATALSSTITAIGGGEIPLTKYVGGFVIGGALSAFGVPGLGVLVGLSMYLPLEYVLPYGMGCIINIIVVRLRGSKWSEEKGLPVAAGFIVGEALISVVMSMIKVFTG